jgi:hypothetical protein
MSGLGEQGRQARRERGGVEEYKSLLMGKVLLLFVEYPVWLA